MGVSFEDTRKTIVQLVQTTSFDGQLAAISHSSVETNELNTLGVNLILEPFQDAVDRATERLLEGFDEKTAQSRPVNAKDV